MTGRDGTMERQQEIGQQFGFLIILFLIVLTGYSLCSILKILAICSPLLQNNCKVLFIRHLVQVRRYV
uniref:Uncharacterized protein n=3 Tax=Klebsiella pneumoniae complex TaxID=3390273 RepID=L0R524_KLEPN|nr:hypothetical protein [Klebsiella pneumoniae]